MFNKDGLYSEDYVKIFYFLSKSNVRLLRNYHSIASALPKILAKENKYFGSKNSLYVSIPFCAKRCSYCPYYNSPYQTNIILDYLDALKKEISYVRDTTYVKTTKFDILYIGGGTPSLLNTTQIKYLLEMVFESFNFNKDVEITFESNPSTLTDDKMRTLKELGVNRVSLGVQTFSDEILKRHECNHTAMIAKGVIDLLLKHGFLLNIDLMFGLLDQTVKDLENDLQCLSKIEMPFQITYCPLRVMDGTLVSKQIYNGVKDCKTRHNLLLEYDKVIENFLTNNFFQREIYPVFYHKNGSREHYYHSTELRVIGLGAGGGKLLDEAELLNFYNVSEYINAINKGNLPLQGGSLLSPNQSFERFVLFRILYTNRKTPNFKDIIKRDFYKHFNTPIEKIYDKVVNDLIKMRLITVDQEVIIPTEKLLEIFDMVQNGAPSLL